MGGPHRESANTHTRHQQEGRDSCCRAAVTGDDADDAQTRRARKTGHGGGRAIDDTPGGALDSTTIKQTTGNKAGKKTTPEGGETRRPWKRIHPPHSKQHKKKQNMRLQRGSHPSDRRASGVSRLARSRATRNDIIGQVDEIEKCFFWTLEPRLHRHGP